MCQVSGGEKSEVEHGRTRTGTDENAMDSMDLAGGKADPTPTPPIGWEGKYILGNGLPQIFRPYGPGDENLFGMGTHGTSTVSAPTGTDE